MKPIIGDWILEKWLNDGAHSQVWKVIHIKNHTEAVVKIMGKGGGKKEKEILLSLNHPNIIKLYDFIDSDEKDYLVLEYAHSGDLLTILQAKAFTEDEMKQILRCIVPALIHSYSRGIAHLDVKLENILIVSQNEKDIKYKLTDWDLSKYYKGRGSFQQHNGGSKHYVSPQILLINYHDLSASDVWSLGVLLFALATRTMPFFGPNHEMSRQILSCTYQKNLLNNHSEELRDLIGKMLISDYRLRIGMGVVLCHPWFRSYNSQKRPLSLSDTHCKKFRKIYSL